MDASHFVPELGPPGLVHSSPEFESGLAPAIGAHADPIGNPVFWIAVLLFLWAGLVHVGFGVSVHAGAGE